MPAYKLVLDDVFERPFKLLAIHSSIEEYKLAYFFNKHLGLKLARTRKDIDFQMDSLKVFFAHFVFDDHSNYCRYHLVSNTSKRELVSNTVVDTLFGEGQKSFKKAFLLPEYKQVDFFLKIDDDIDAVPEKSMLGKIKEIPQVSTAYSINFHQIKSKENLIFD